MKHFKLVVQKTSAKELDWARADSKAAEVCYALKVVKSIIWMNELVAKTNLLLRQESHF